LGVIENLIFGCNRLKVGDPESSSGWRWICHSVPVS